IREERGARRSDAVDRREPEDVREEQRADDRVGEAEPRARREVVALVRRLPHARDRERHPAEREYERADPKRRVPAKKRRDRDRVPAPRRGGEQREHVTGDASRESAAPPRDEADPHEREERRRPERALQPLEPAERRVDADEDRRRA